jgi:hypothetical protein
MDRSGNGLQDRLVLEDYPFPDDTSSKPHAWWPSAEVVYLTARRENLPAIMEEIESQAKQFGEEDLWKLLEALKEHIRWADDLARKSGMLDDCVFPPAPPDEAESS